jgi:riboflavin synthase
LFTGIVTAVGTVVAVREARGGRRIVVGTGALPTADWRIGDSLAVAGCCLTLVAIENGRFEAELSGETLARTTLGQLVPGSAVNLEPALTAGSALGGHLVTGHVDGIATVRVSREEAGALGATVYVPVALSRFIAEKGSVTLDGVSLTVGRVAGAEFEITLVPHTRKATTLGDLVAGQEMNLEVDLVARYIDRLLETRGTR